MNLYINFTCSTPKLLRTDFDQKIMGTKVAALLLQKNSNSIIFTIIPTASKQNSGKTLTGSGSNGKKLDNMVSPPFNVQVF
jgi:flagellar assembly factor FliW